MPLAERQKMENALQRLAENPDERSFDVKHLQGREGYRLRLGKWRAIFHRDDNALIILVVEAGPRGGIYK